MARSENEISHILVIRLSAMGDVAMTIPVLKAISSRYPHIRITVLTREFFEPIFRQVSNVNVFPADVRGKHKGFLGLWRLNRELKKLDIHAVADLHNVLRSNILKVFFRFFGIRFVQIDKGRSEKKALTAKRNKVFKPLKSTFQRYADVFDVLGFPLDLSNLELLEKLPFPNDAGPMSADNAKIRIGIAPFAAFQGKMYPLHFMEKVVEQLNENNAYRLFFFGGGTEEGEWLGKWEARFENGFNCARKFSFQEELALISNLDLMLSMDSGNGHLAAMYGIPVVTLWGVTHPYAGFSPFGQNSDNWLLADRKQYPLIPTSVYGNKIPPGYEKAMESIPPEEVVLNVESVLGRK